MKIIRNDSGARRNLDHGPYRLTLSAGASIACDLPEYLDHLRTVAGITITDSPVRSQSPEAVRRSSSEPAREDPKRKPAKIVVA